MDSVGLAKVCRYAFPPNSLSLCGPPRQKDLAWYTESGQTDTGTAEILAKFSTLYPYLCLIAEENNLKDPFDKRVVEAYWLGNTLLDQVSSKSLLRHLDKNLGIRKKLKKKDVEILSEKTAAGGLPHHAYHVLNVYRRNGHDDKSHTVETMDACIVNCGKIIRLFENKAVVLTRPLRLIRDSVQFGDSMKRVLHIQGK